MARQQKQTVDYFPHFTMHKKTLRLMRKNFGDAGYVFWFMLLEVLGATNGHFIDLNEKSTLEDLSDHTDKEEDEIIKMLDRLAGLGAIDSGLWENKIIWSQNFVDGLAAVYSSRKSKPPTKPVLYSNDIITQPETTGNPEDTAENGEETTGNSDGSGTSKVEVVEELKESKVEVVEEVKETEPPQLQIIKLFAVWGRDGNNGEKVKCENLIKGFGFAKVKEAFYTATERGPDKLNLGYVRGILNSPDKVGGRFDKSIGN